MKRLTVLILMLIATLTLTAGVSSAALSGAIADPMYIGVGARPLGMGKAYVAVAEDGDTIFLNPAGLGTIDSLKFTSMYSNLLSDVRYFVLGGAYPLDIGTLVGGYVGA